MLGIAARQPQGGAIGHARPAADQPDPQGALLRREQGGQEIGAVEVRRKGRAVQQPAPDIDADAVRQHQKAGETAQQRGIARAQIHEIGVAEGELDVVAARDHVRQFRQRGLPGQKRDADAADIARGDVRPGPGVGVVRESEGKGGQARRRSIRVQRSRGDVRQAIAATTSSSNGRAGQAEPGRRVNGVFPQFALLGSTGSTAKPITCPDTELWRRPGRDAGSGASPGRRAFGTIRRRPSQSGTGCNAVEAPPFSSRWLPPTAAAAGNLPTVPPARVMPAKNRVPVSRAMF